MNKLYMTRVVEQTQGLFTSLEREIRIRMIYSFRPLPLMKGCGWMTYHLTVHTMSKKTNKLTTMYLTPY